MLLSEPPSPLSPSSWPAGRFSTLVADEGHQGGPRESVAMPLERPWWMKVHGGASAVSNLEEVMDQFLCDHSAQSLEQACEQATKRFDIRSIERHIPGMDKDQLGEMQKWYGHVTEFMKYRNQVSEKHDLQMELRMHRKSLKKDVWEDSDEDSGSEAMAPTTSLRDVGGEAVGPMLSARNDRGRTSSGSSGRQSNLRVRTSQRLANAGNMMVRPSLSGTGALTKQQRTPSTEMPGSMFRSEGGDSHSSESSPRHPTRSASSQRRSGARASASARLAP